MSKDNRKASLRTITAEGDTKMTEDERGLVNSLLLWAEDQFIKAELEQNNDIDNDDFGLRLIEQISDLEGCACVFILERKCYEKNVGGYPERERENALKDQLNELLDRSLELSNLLHCLDPRIIVAMINFENGITHPGEAIANSMKYLEELREHIERAIGNIDPRPSKPTKDYQKDFIYGLLDMFGKTSCSHVWEKDSNNYQYHGEGYDFVSGCFKCLKVDVSPNVIANTIRDYNNQRSNSK